MKKIGSVIAIVLLSTLVSAQDWANFGRYDSANAEVLASGKEVMAVFMGNSITQGWADQRPEFFEKHDFVGRGVSGQVTSQMLLRFREDVIGLDPGTVVILAGINDIARNKGYISLERTAGNIFSMAEMARDNDIEVILCSVLPANRFAWRPEIYPADMVIELNQMIRAYAKAEGFSYVNYYDSLVDEEKGLKQEYGSDGVHPNAIAFELMENILLKKGGKLLN